ncbi:MAG: DNA repair protein RecN [Eubacteriales bacterium]|nr:DNA repair protein RecN [Eubacteriales bacterium]
MLKQLLIKNFAIIDELSLPFYGGLTVLSGETGAGKSIVVDAVSQILGAKADKSFVRKGSNKYYIEAVFSIDENNEELKNILSEQEIEADTPDEITLSRELYIAGKSVCRVNGTLISLQVFRTVASSLMEIHGQNEHQALLADENHIHFLDGLGSTQHLNLIAQVKKIYSEHKELSSKLKSLEEKNIFRQERLERLSKQEKEIEDAKLRIGEEEELSSQKNQLRNKDKIIKALSTTDTVLFEGDSSALNAVFTATKALEPLLQIDNSFEQLYKRLDDIYYDIEDIQYSLSDMQRSFSTGTGSLEEVEERLDKIRRLEFKYGKSIEEVLNTLDKIKQEKAEFISLDKEIERLKENIKKQEILYLKQANLLSESRKKLAQSMEEKIDTELNHLNMSGAKFIVDIKSDSDKIAVNGIDDIRFYILANKGEDPKPLSKTASGGELSRIMLAIKSVSADKNSNESMVFDEIDTGISGRAAQVVAEKMWNIAANKQVLAVTHLQQIASMASKHILVAKAENNGRTITSAKYIDEKERIKEIARMIGQSQTSVKSAQEHAQSMLLDAKAYRNRFNKKFE